MAEEPNSISVGASVPVNLGEPRVNEGYKNPIFNSFLTTEEKRIQDEMRTNEILRSRIELLEAENRRLAQRRRNQSKALRDLNAAHISTLHSLRLAYDRIENLNLKLDGMQIELNSARTRLRAVAEAVVRGND